MGVDWLNDWAGENPETIGNHLEALVGEGLQLKMIPNRGVKVYPNGFSETFCTDHWRCRFVADTASVQGGGWDCPGLKFDNILNLQQRISAGGLEVIKTENLYQFDGKPAFSKGQGE